MISTARSRSDTAISSRLGVWRHSDFRRNSLWQHSDDGAMNSSSFLLGLGGLWKCQKGLNYLISVLNGGSTHDYTTIPETTEAFKRMSGWKPPWAKSVSFDELSK